MRLKLIIFARNGDPSFDTGVISGKGKLGHTCCDVIGCPLTEPSFDRERFGPSFLLRCHSRVGAPRAVRGLFHGSPVRSIAISSLGKQRSWKLTISSKLP